MLPYLLLLCALDGCDRSIQLSFAARAHTVEILFFFVSGERSRDWMAQGFLIRVLDALGGLGGLKDNYFVRRGLHAR
jgi:hypothetical protein